MCSEPRGALSVLGVPETLQMPGSTSGTGVEAGPQALNPAAPRCHFNSDVTVK